MWLLYNVTRSTIRQTNNKILLDLVWSKFSYVQILTTRFPKTHLNITILFTSKSFKFLFSKRCPKQILYNILFIFPTGYTCRTDNELLGLITFIILRQN